MVEVAVAEDGRPRLPRAGRPPGSDYSSLSKKYTYRSRFRQDGVMSMCNANCFAQSVVK